MTSASPAPGTSRWYGNWSWLGLLARLVLGAVWLTAEALKLPDPAESIRAVRAYRLLPEAIVPVIDYGLPVLEVAVGLLLIVGIGVRLASAVSLLLLGFLFGVSAAWARGLQIDCGCFGGCGQVAAAVILVVEVVGAVVSGSLALLADAGHMLTDVAGLTLALVAATLMARPATAQRTWGYRRAEVLSAAAQAAVLLAVGGYILIEGVRRLFEPPAVAPGLIVVFGVIGLAGTAIAITVLAGSRGDNLNTRAAFPSRWSTTRSPPWQSLLLPARSR